MAPILTPWGRSGAAACSRRARCSMPWPAGNLTRPLAARGATKRSRGLKSASTPSVTARDSGTPRTSVELWNLYNGRHHKGESIRVFPLSNWTELDVWLYIAAENIPIVPLYFAQERDAVERGNSILLAQHGVQLLPGERVQKIKCRMRSLGCAPCTGAIRSEADTVAKIIDEMLGFRRSERENRVIDHDEEASMEIKKREGYF